MPPTEIYTLSLHDALPILAIEARDPDQARCLERAHRDDLRRYGDRKSTRLNSSHMSISYAVFCLKKKKPQPFPGPSVITTLQPCTSPFAHAPPHPLHP